MSSIDLRDGSADVVRGSPARPASRKQKNVRFSLNEVRVKDPYLVRYLSVPAMCAIGVLLSVRDLHIVEHNVWIHYPIYANLYVDVDKLGDDPRREGAAAELLRKMRKDIMNTRTILREAHPILFSDCAQCAAG